MRKILSFVAAMLVAIVANSAVIQINNSTPDALRLALNSAATGDVIEMAAGTYVESNGDYIAFTGKDVTVKAAEGAEVIIQPQVPITVSEGGCAHFVGVKIDASRLTELATWYEHLIYAADANTQNRIVLQGCELYGFNINKSMLYCSSANVLNAVNIERCYIHNNLKSILFVENTSANIEVVVANSTFANIQTNTESYWAGIIDLRASGAQLNVDHCTFYNVIPMNTDYSCVSKITLANGVTSNCIFMLPTAQDGIRAMRGVTATNCITYNYLKDNGTGIHSSVTQTNCLQVDPAFVDPDNNNFTLGEGSPALTMNDGAPIGDPRWWPVIGAPAYYLVGSMNNWTPDSAYKFAVNPANENEYMLTKTLAVGDSMKVVEVVGNTTTWYPAGTDNDYVVDAAHAGEKTIYFQTTYKADWAEFGGYFWMEANPMPKATLDFATNTAWQFPTSKATAVASFSDGTYSITLQGTSGNGYRWYSEGYLLNGQKDATLTLPAFTWKTTKIVVTGRSAASGSTKMNVFVGDSAVSAETTGCKGVNTYEIAADYQAPGNIYVLKVTSAHNAQFTKIEIYGEDEEPVAGCDWNELPYLGSAVAQYANQFKLCKAGEQPGVVNIQESFGTEAGIYVTFPSAAFGAISLDSTKYAIQGAGMLLYCSAFTAKVTDVSVVCDNTPILFSVYNENGTTDPIIGAPEYYLVGSLNNWTPDSTYKFAKNPANENEYMLATTLAVGDSIKVLEIVGNTRTYYPDGMDNHYTVDAAHAGEKTIYFQTTYKADWAAFGGYMWIDANVDTIPTTAPAAPTAAEDDVLAIYCGKYNNNLHFALSGWAGGFEDLDIQGTRVGYRRAMTWECVIDPVKTDSAHDFSGYKKLHADFWAPKAAKIKFVAEAVAGGNYKDGQVVNLAAGWNSFDFNVAEWPGNYDFKNVKCFVLEQYQNPEGASFEGNPFALANIYFYEKDIPQPEWAVIKFNKVVPKDSLAADASFVLLGSDFKAQITDTDNKMEIDANVARFGEAAGYDTFTHRLKTGGKSSASKSYITVSIPETGKLAIAVRTGSNSATDRNLVVKQGNDTLYNQIILESQAIKVMEDTTEVSVYPYIMLPVDSGTVVLSYPVGALNFYAFAFKKEQPIIGPEYYLAGNMNDWKAAEGYKFAANPAAEGEYMLTTTLALGNEFKVLGTGSIENTWYPSNAGNYVVTADYVGEKTIYFRPAGNPDWEGFHAGGYFYMEANPAPAGKINCDSVYNLAKGDTVALAPVTVTYANGKNLYVKDATGAMLVYLGANGTWKAGDVLSNVEGVLDIYNGLYEVKPDTNQMKAITAVEGPVPAPELLDTIRLADVNKYIKILAIQVAADTAIHSSGKATNIDIIFDEDTIVLRNNFKLEQAFEVGKKYDITGVICVYNGTLQVYPTEIAEQQIIGAPVYYLAGSMNGWAANDSYKFTENPAKAGEYMLTTALALNDEFKVIGVVGATTTWYPDGMGNNYVVDAAHAGEAKTIYFRPEGGQEGWYAGFFFVEENELTIPTDAPAAPTAAEDDVLAIYCNHYTTNNLNFIISGWAGGYQTLDINSTMIGYWTNMTWECIIDPAPNTDNAHDFSDYKKLHVDLWAPKTAQIKFTVEAVSGGNYKDGNLVNLAQGWNSFDFNTAEWPEGYDFKNVKCFVLENYSIEGKPFAIANIYLYDKKGQGLEDIDASTKAVKVLYNGQIYILRGDKMYTVTGQPVK